MIRLLKRYATQPTIFELDNQIDKLLPKDFVTENVPIEAVIKMFYIKELSEPIVHEWQANQVSWNAQDNMKERVSLLDHLIYLNSKIADVEDMQSLYNRFVLPFTEKFEHDKYVMDESSELPMDKFGRIHGFGSKKSAYANVWLVHNPNLQSKYPALINNRPLHEYFQNVSDRQSLLLPLEIANKHWTTVNRGLLTDIYGSFKIFATASGGGVSGQVNSVRMGIARALSKWHSSLVPHFQECILFLI